MPDLCYILGGMQHIFEYQGNTFTLDLAGSGKVYTATVDGKTVSVELVRSEGNRLDLLINGQACSAYVTRDGAKRWVTVNGQTFVLANPGQVSNTDAHSSKLSGELTAQMTGVVRAVLAAQGEPVKKGQTLAVIEAMKMENKLVAPFDGVVKMLRIKVGQTVEREQVLIEITASDEKSSGLPLS